MMNSEDAFPSASTFVSPQAAGPSEAMVPVSHLEELVERLRGMQAHIEEMEAEVATQTEARQALEQQVEELRRASPAEV